MVEAITSSEQISSDIHVILPNHQTSHPVPPVVIPRFDGSVYKCKTTMSYCSATHRVVHAGR